MLTPAHTTHTYITHHKQCMKLPVLEAPAAPEMLPIPLTLLDCFSRDVERGKTSNLNLLIFTTVRSRYHAELVCGKPTLQRSRVHIKSARDALK